MHLQLVLRIESRRNSIGKRDIYVVKLTPHFLAEKGCERKLNLVRNKILIEKQSVDMGSINYNYMKKNYFAR